MDLPGNRQTWSAIDATLEQLMKSVEAMENANESQETQQATQPQRAEHNPQQAHPKAATAPAKNGL